MPRRGDVPVGISKKNQLAKQDLKQLESSFVDIS